MAVTASTDRYPAENVSETATWPDRASPSSLRDADAIGNAVSVKATVWTTPAGLVAAALLAAAVLFRATLLVVK